MKTPLFIFFLAISLSALSANADTAEYIEGFTHTGKAAAKLINQNSGFPVTEEQMLEAIYTTKIEFVKDRLISPQGIEVDALNFPSKKLIQVNLARWEGYASESTQIARLVVHEYLGILKVNDAEYYWSESLTKRRQITNSIVCNYEFENRPYYLKVLSAEGVNEGFKGSYLSSGQGTADHPITSELLNFSSYDFKWSDVFDEKKRDSVLQRSGVGFSWKIDNHPLHARVPYKAFSNAGKFTIEVFELSNFAPDGLLLPRHFATISCETTKPQEP
ncbi:MAG: hypothetical protein J7501_15120 [Bdellovibrio sp.]|nr:hypothetical protein [Bdellovibrio sp.]